MPSKLKLKLERPPLSAVEGIYTSKGDVTAMPDRMRMLEAGPAADSFVRHLAPHVVVSDMFRSPESSLTAAQVKRGVQLPSFSHHNYGRACDLAITETLKRMRSTGAKLGEFGQARLLAVGGVAADAGQAIRTKRQLDLWMAERGWFCFAGDHKTGRRDASPNDESWHFDFFGVGAANAPRYPYKTDRVAAWKNCVERYGRAWLDLIAVVGLQTPAGKEARAEVQRLLAERGFYHGAIDGVHGPQTRAAIGALQRAWKLDETGRADARTIQTLVYVCAEVEVVERAEAAPAVGSLPALPQAAPITIVQQIIRDATGWDASDVDYDDD